MRHFRTRRKKDDEHESLLDLLVKAFINGFVLKCLEKIGEKFGEWLSYKLITHSDPTYYSIETIEEKE
jgi:hypothetical protein